MNILWLFDTCGYIFGPAIMASGLVAVVLCVRASRSASSRRLQRLAVAASLLPLALGLCGALVGLAVWAANHLPDAPWLALGKVCLAGAAVAALPLAWSLLLLRARRDATGSTAF